MNKSPYSKTQVIVTCAFGIAGAMIGTTSGIMTGLVLTTKPRKVS